MSTEESAPAPKAASSWSIPALTGYGAIVVGFVVFGGWSAYARIDSAVIAPGVIAVESNRKTVQHYEGGMVQEILVREGMLVKKDDVLFRLDPTQAQANVAMLQGQADSLVALEARLIAERDRLDAIEFPPELLERADNPVGAEAIKDQVNQFRQRRDALIGQTGILNSRIEQLHTEIGGLKEEEAATERQLVAINDELDAKRQLLKKELIAKSQVLALEREKARLEGVTGRSVADMAKAEGTIGETRLQIEQLERQFQEEVNAQVLDTRQKQSDIEQRLVIARDVFKRLVVRSPLSGSVQDVKVSTISAVIKPGEPLLDIVPDDDAFIVEARVSTLDADLVTPDMEAEIRFPSFKARDLPVILGKVGSISRDRFVDESNGQSYFLARIMVEDEKAFDDKRLTAGLPAEIIIPTGERTVLRYLVDPLTDRVRSGFREE